MSLHPLPAPGPGHRIVITGGAGFIGSHLADALLARGCAVVVVDDFSAGRRENLPPAHPRLTVLTASVGQPEAAAHLDQAVAGAHLVYHLASPIGVRRAHTERFATVQEILAAGLQVAETCRRARAPLLVMSSSEIYGPGLPRPIREDDPCQFDIAPRWGYATGKFATEQLAAGLAQEHGLPTWIVRPFNIAGPRQRPETGLCIAAFAAALAAGRPPVVHGDGLQRRAFLHVLDAASALIAIPQSAALIGRPVNLGSPQGYSIREVAERAIAAAGFRGTPHHVTLAEAFGEGFADAAERVPDISRLADNTGWRPQRDLDTILRDACAGVAGRLEAAAR